MKCLRRQDHGEPDDDAAAVAADSMAVDTIDRGRHRLGRASTP